MKRISFKKPRGTGYFAVVALRLLKPSLQKIDWHHVWWNSSIPPFSFNKDQSLARTIPFRYGNSNVVIDNTTGGPHAFDHSDKFLINILG